MRIGIDARELCGHATGVGRYLGGLVHEWSKSERALRHEFVLYTHEPLTISLDARRFATRVVLGGRGTEWEQRRLPSAMRRDHLDVLFAPGYTAPLITRTPIVVAIHDVSFAAHPEWFAPRQGIRQRFFSRRTAHNARAIVTISEFSRGEIVDLLKVPDSRVHVIPPGVTSPLSGFADTSARSTSGAAHLQARRVLYVGSIFNRRHIPDLIRAFGQVARTHHDVELDLVGDNRSYPRENVTGALALLGVSGRARWHRYVSDEELASLYQSARAFAFLSEYEGLGFTPLEALSCAVPSVLLDTPVARESCGDAALYVAKGDVKATASALEQLLFDDDVRAALLGRATKVLSRFSWPSAADKTLTLLEQSA